MATPSNAVRLAQVRKKFGAVPALDGLDLTLAAGETLALLGRNGAGKSTAINLLLGLDEPDAGRVELFGGPPHAAVAAGLVGAMLQDARPIPRVTVGELTAFVASTYPLPMRPAEALALAGIAELAARRVDKLSGGQAQRLRFALAVTGNPALIVLDEPTAALDVEARRAFWRSMRGYAARGNTVLFSTHYLEEADENADRVVVVDRGRAVADGTGEQIKQRVGGTLVSFDLAGRGSEGLRSLPGVTAVEIRGDRAVLRTGDSDATVVALAATDRVRRLAVTPASLEDAFLTLTAGTRPQGEGPPSGEPAGGAAAGGAAGSAAPHLEVSR
ncbi:ABC transporter ATP-binding protein [Streptomyces sp. V4-01]|uniref:ABC transporter ATP-binding protein n=1 Tax=Actinacidiphila polyblastidii TaxID=3110430 RepID=A0ABU7PD32_9ACTN|nr:ABC transporter ATP-binding protein [Streptomyces sp. V4-01]